MNKLFEYTCKFCKDNRTFVCDVGDEPTIIDTNLWLKNLSCNRCAEQHIKRQKIAKRIAAVCALLISERRKQGKKLAEIETKAREKLVEYCAQFAENVCEYYHKMTVNEDDFWQMIFQYPEKFNQALNMYVRGISTIK